MISAVIALCLAGSAPAPAPAPAPAYSVVPARAGRPAAVFAPRPGPRAALVVRFGVGSVDDATAGGPVPGLGHLAQLAMIHANRQLDPVRLVKDVFASDGELTIVTGLEHCEFRLEAASADVDRLAERLLTALLQPAIADGAAFEAARDKALHDRREGRGGDVLAGLARVTLPTAAYGWPAHGDRDSLERLTAADVRGHVARWFAPANATVVFTGAFDARRAQALARRWSGGARAIREPQTPMLPMSMVSPSRRELYVAAFRRSVPPPEAWLVAALLDERLERLRELGLTYTHAVEVLEEGWLPGTLVVIPLSEGGGHAAVREVEGILNDIRSGAFTAEDLARARALVLARMDALDRDPAALAGELARGAGAPSFGARRVADLERADVRAVAASAVDLLRDDAAIRILFSPAVDRAAPLSLPRARHAETP